MAMTTAGKVALALTIIEVIIGISLAMVGPHPASHPYGIFESACILAVGAMGMGGIGCKNRCLMMTFIVFAIIGIVMYTLYGLALIVGASQYRTPPFEDQDLNNAFVEAREKRVAKLIAWLVGLFINQILTGVAVFFYFKARTEITEAIYNEFYAQNPVVTPVYSGYPQYGCQSPVYPGQAYPAPYSYQ